MFDLVAGFLDCVLKFVSGHYGLLFDFEGVGDGFFGGTFEGDLCC